MSNDFSKPIAAYGYKRGTGIAIRKSNDFWYEIDDIEDFKNYKKIKKLKNFILILLIP